MANLIVQAATGRRISILNQASSGVMLVGNNHPCLIEAMSKQSVTDTGERSRAGSGWTHLAQPDDPEDCG